MKKRITALVICAVIMLSISACGTQITLNLSYGDRTGVYSGDMTNGVPNGAGKFTAENADGVGWTYEGQFANGHFEGEGKTTWKSGQVEIGTYKNDVIVPIEGDRLKSVWASPADYKHHCVQFVGKVFTSPEYSDTGVAVQLYTDIKNSDGNVIAYIYDPELKVEQGDYIKIKGLVSDVFDGENAFGATLSVPTVDAAEHEIMSYAEAVMPTKTELPVNQTQTQYGYSVTVEKIELADEETRVYVKVENNGTDKFSLYSFNCLLVQNSKQYEEQSNWDADYPEIQTDLLVGNTTEGVIAFPAVSEGDFSLILDAYSENWDEEIEPFTFSISYAA